MSHTSQYIPGDYLMICQRTGKVMRRSEAVVDPYSGLLVHRDEADPKHPQDYVRAVPDNLGLGDITTGSGGLDGVCSVIFEGGVFEPLVFESCAS